MDSFYAASFIFTPSRSMDGTQEGLLLCALKCRKSLSGCFGSGSMVMAGDAGLELLPGGLVVGPGATGGAPAGPGFDFVAQGVPEVYLEDFGVQHDALVAGLPVSSAAGDQQHAFLEVRFLQLKQRQRFENPEFYLQLRQLYKDSPVLTNNLWRGF